jgi:lipopolysaccharide transport system permease protein
MGLVVTVLMFVSPVFYPVSALSGRYRLLLELNPLTHIIEHSRDILLRGNPPPWSGLLITTFLAAGFAWAGFAWFQKTRRGFADVL